MVVRDKGKKQVEELASQLEVLTVEYVPIDSLVPNSYNPNRQSEHDFDLLLKSMRTDGFTQPILLRRENSEIVDGEHRWRAAKQLNAEAREAGKKEPYLSIPVVKVDMTDNQARLSTLRHNRARGSEDIELVAQILRDFEKVGAISWAQDELMLESVEIDRLLHDVSAPDALAAEEFSAAWEPQGTHHAGDSEAHERTIGGANAIEGATALASDRLRAGEKALAEAKTDEERQAALRDRDIYRIALTFTDEEAKTVKQVLGDRPAETLLAMCRKELGMT